MGQIRSSADFHKETHSGESGGVSYAVSHMCGWRLYMEDAHLSILPYHHDCALFAVFDGHGGPEVALYVAKHLPTTLAQNPHFASKDYRTALSETFMKLDDMIRSEMGSKEILAIQKSQAEVGNSPVLEESHAGCTANVVLITPDSIYCANAGDSRSVACVNGKAIPLSYDHKPDDPEELKRITEAGGQVKFGRVNGGLNLSRALGDLDYKNVGRLPANRQMISAEPDIRQIDRKDVGVLVMGCDGIWEKKDCQQMVDWVGSRLASSSESVVAESLLDNQLAKDTSGQFGLDNMSVILIRLK